MQIYNWSDFSDSKLYKDIVFNWEQMLSNSKLKEQDYHNYLFENPAIFLAKHSCYLVISKLKLGTDYETDFVVVEEGYSEGTKFELIEIENPHTKLFDIKGKPTSSFNSALQQIRDWRRCLIENKSFFKRTFPTSTTRIVNNSKITFKIIIGRRSDNLEELEKRRQISEEQNIEIISFDRLTEIAKQKLFFNESRIFAGQMNSVSSYLKNELANPFYKCTTDSEWRKICNRGHSHFYSNLIENIVKMRTYNEHFEEFKRNQSSLF